MSSASYIFDVLPRRQKTLSSYFPAGTSYFYGYPAGDNSGFLNKVPPAIEELVAARALSCAGPAINIISFAATSAPLMDADLLQKLGIPQLSEDHTTILPSRINTDMNGEERNDSIKQALNKVIAPGTLVMAQPFTDTEISDLYQINPDVSTWLNDKNNMQYYLPETVLPKRYAAYANGSDFIASNPESQLTFPCVVKAAASSAGDGVYICHNATDLDTAKDGLKAVDISIYIEEYVETKKNYGMHFGISYDAKKPIDIIGVNHQYTSSTGEFLGGIINSRNIPAELAAAKKILLNDVLPKIRAKGWYGVGCFDILVDPHGLLYFIDCNFRMTGMTAAHMLISQKIVKPPLISFSGTFRGDRAAFEHTILPLATVTNKRRMLQFIAVTESEGDWNFNAALLFKNHDELRSRVNLLAQKGVESPLLDYLLSLTGMQP